MSVQIWRNGLTNVTHLAEMKKMNRESFNNYIGFECYSAYKAETSYHFE